MPNPVPGEMLGSYRVDGAVGAGSMGEVFRAVDTSLGRTVAIKILSEKHKASAELRARFTREGRAVAAISHPNVVQVFTTGTFDDRPYIAMEFLDGTDLGSAVAQGGPLPSTRAVRAVIDAAQGLRAAAQAGLIHRDVKPANLVLLGDGRVKVTDFGLAKPVDPGTEPALTAMGVVVGTPDYIAPEQARGDAIDERVDIYALGGTLYYLLAGRPPFRTGNPAEDKYLKVVARHLKQPPPDARDRNPAADPALAELAREMMAKDADDRPDYETLLARLGAISASLSGHSRELLPPPRSTAPPIIDPTPFVGGSRPLDDEPFTSAELPRRRVPVWLALISVAAGFVFVAGAIRFGMSDDTPSPADATVVAAPIDAGSPAKPALPIPPAGMALVTRPDGTPWCFVDEAPVSHEAYASIFPKHRAPKAAKAAVTGITYTEARAFADQVGKRLVRPDELEAATSQRAIAAPPTWEWVDTGPGAKKTVSIASKTELRPATAHKDVTFRLAKDL